MESNIHKELVSFMTQHDLEDCSSNIDEILLSYLTGVVELVSQGDDATDFEDVLEMMNAYLPGFENINRADVIEWMFGLSDKLSQKDDKSTGAESAEIHPEVSADAPRATNNDEALSHADNTEQSKHYKQNSFPNYDYAKTESHSIPSPTQNGFHRSFTKKEEKRVVDDSKTHADEENNKPTDIKTSQEECKTQCLSATKQDRPRLRSFNEKKNHSKRKGRQLSCSSQESQEDPSMLEESDLPDSRICALLEMFPSSCTMEARHCLQLSSGDMDRAAQLIMDRQETGQAISAAGIVTTKKRGQKAKKLSNYTLDDDSIKLSVLEKYSFVDTEDDKRTYRPPPLKKEAKKLVRYRDGQVVSLKGERFSEIKKNTNDTKS